MKEMWRKYEGNIKEIWRKYEGNMKEIKEDKGNKGSMKGI